MWLYMRVYVRMYVIAYVYISSRTLFLHMHIYTHVKHSKKMVHYAAVHTIGHLRTSRCYDRKREESLKIEMGFGAARHRCNAIQCDHIFVYIRLTNKCISNISNRMLCVSNCETPLSLSIVQTKICTVPTLTHTHATYSQTHVNRNFSLSIYFRQSSIYSWFNLRLTFIKIINLILNEWIKLWMYTFHDAEFFLTCSNVFWSFNQWRCLGNNTTW